MKFPTLALILMTAACGGGEKKKPMLVDANTTPPSVANSKNDMLLITFDMEAGMVLVPTPHEDSPDNKDAPLVIPSGNVGKRISGEMSAIGLRTDDYFERDTFAITTGADVNQLSIRLAWDGAVSDLDYVLAKEVVGTEDPDVISTGTLISDTSNEFDTFVVEPNTKYWLWTGVYKTRAMEGDGEPVLPATYDFSIYGEVVPTVAACTTQSDFTEAKDTTNDTLTTGAPATNAPEASGQTLTTGTHVYCGAINTGHFVPDAMDPAAGVVDIDQFSLTVGGNMGTPIMITLVGATPADKTALAALGSVEYLVLDKDGAFFGGSRGFFQYDSHGVATTILPPTVDAMGMDTGPKSIAIIGLNSAAIGANINYRLKIGRDETESRAPRKMGTSDTTETNDNRL